MKNKNSGSRNEESNEAPHGHIKDREETLVTVPGAVVNLVDDQGKIHEEIASGEFSVIKLLQADKIIAVYAKVGEDLKWPITKDEHSVKRDSCHYLFPFPNTEEAQALAKYRRPDGKLLKFGVTFADHQEEKLDLLDKCLKQHSYISFPGETCCCCCVAFCSEVKPSVRKSDDSELYWSDFAPKLKDYNNICAKGIVAGTGQIIKGMFLCSNGYSTAVRNGGEFLRSHLKAVENSDHGKTKKTKKSSPICKCLKTTLSWIKKLAKLIKRMIFCFVDGLFTPIGILWGLITPCGRCCCKCLCGGEIVDAAVRCYDKILEAVRLAWKNAFKTTSEVTGEVVAHRYIYNNNMNCRFGEDAGQAAREVIEIVGHAAETAAHMVLPPPISI